MSNPVNNRSAWWLLAVLASCFCFGCSEKEDTPSKEVSLVFEELQSPAATGSLVSRVGVSPHGRIHLSWIEKGPNETHSLKFSFLNGKKWSAPKTVAQGSGWMVNWADFQNIVADGEGNLAAQWLERFGKKWDYGIKVSVSSDDGQTWAEPFWLHSDLETSEHGFVSILPESKGVFRASWLDSRVHATEGNMKLLSARFDKSGRIGEEAEIDTRVCDCCSTSSVLVDGQPLIAYRDRDPNEIRDICLARFDGKTWSEPWTVHPDKWLIPG